MYRGTIILFIVHLFTLIKKCIRQFMLLAHSLNSVFPTSSFVNFYFFLFFKLLHCYMISLLTYLVGALISFSLLPLLLHLTNYDWRLLVCSVF